MKTDINHRNIIDYECIPKFRGVIPLVKKHWFRLKIRRASASERAELMRDKFYFLGKDVELYTLSFGTEPYLISIHDNAVCAAGVQFINHDVSVHRICKRHGMARDEIDKVGSIELFENCFVGACTILMPNCSVGRNSVVGAGSIVTKHIPDNEVWAGIPARFIMKVEDYDKKMMEASAKFPWMPAERKRSLSREELIRCEQEYFFGSST